MNTSELLIDLFDRVAQSVEKVLKDSTTAVVTMKPSDASNTIAWLIWHLSRVQDDHIADVANTDQVWTSQGFAERFGLPFPASATGYGQTNEEVAAVRVDDVRLLSEYHQAVTEQTKRYLKDLKDGDLDRVVDVSYDPPVTLGVRLVSVIDDDLEHVGQAAYVLGLMKDRL